MCILKLDIIWDQESKKIWINRRELELVALGLDLSAHSLASPDPPQPPLVSKCTIGMIEPVAKTYLASTSSLG